MGCSEATFSFKDGHTLSEPEGCTVIESPESFISILKAAKDQGQGPLDYTMQGSQEIPNAKLYSMVSHQSAKSFELGAFPCDTI